MLSTIQHESPSNMTTFPSHVNNTLFTNTRVCLRVGTLRRLIMFIPSKWGTSLLSYIVRFLPSTTHLVSLTLDFILVRFCAKPVTWWDAPLSKYQFWLVLLQLSNCARQQRLWLLHHQNILHYHCFFSTKFVGFLFLLWVS